MINNYEQKYLEMQEQIKELSYLLVNDWENLEIHKVEENIFRKLLEVGRRALEAYVANKGTGEDAFGSLVSNYSEKRWDYISIFGTVKINRAYFWEEDKGSGIFPLDKELNLPQKHYSYLLQKWNQMIAVDGNFDKARKQLEEIFHINIWTKQSEEINRDASNYVKDFYKDNPAAEQTEPILVVEADGKGIVMRKNKQGGEKEIPKIRLKKGEKNGSKKMAIVTAAFGIERNIRTVDDLVKYEINNSPNKKPELKIVNKDEPKPQNKIVRATLEGKDKGFKRLVEEVHRRDPDSKCERVALMDGERALEKKALEYLMPIGFIIILDLFHVMERLWKLCYYFCKEASIEAVLWVKKYLTMILSGKTGYFIGAIRQIITKGSFKKSKIKAIEKILTYFEKRKKYMKYDEYLAKGYPIGSGVIEGTCRSFVKDRMELSGMRWSELGAESMLELRSIKVNDKWERFWNYYIEKEKIRKYSKQDTYFDKKINRIKENKVA